VFGDSATRVIVLFCGFPSLWTLTVLDRALAEQWVGAAVATSVGTPASRTRRIRTVKIRILSVDPPLPPVLHPLSARLLLVDPAHCQIRLKIRVDLCRTGPSISFRRRPAWLVSVLPLPSPDLPFLPAWTPRGRFVSLFHLPGSRRVVSVQAHPVWFLSVDSFLLTMPVLVAQLLKACVMWTLMTVTFQRPNQRTRWPR
jgi:hypothetical protein